MVKSLATVRSANSPRFMSPPPTVSSMKTSDEKPRVHPAGQLEIKTELTKNTEMLCCQVDMPLHHSVRDGIRSAAPNSFCAIDHKVAISLIIPEPHTPVLQKISATHTTYLSTVANQLYHLAI